MMLLLLLLVLLPLTTHAATCRWAWEPVTTYTDGTPVTDLTGYRLYRAGTITPMAEIAAPATTATTPCQVGETWHATAYRAAGQESAPSNTVIVPDIFPSAAPAGFRLEGATLQLNITRE